MVRIVLALALFSSASATLYSNNTEFQENAFATFVSEFHKEYLTEEAEALAFRNFVDFLKLVDERNAAELAAGGDAVHGITSFADMSQEEFERMFLLASVGDDDADDDDDDTAFSFAYDGAALSYEYDSCTQCGTYKGTASAAGYSVTEKLVARETDFDMTLSGDLSISCKKEKYTLDSSGNIKVTNIDKDGDCVHDELAKYKAKLESAKYDSKKQTITLKVTSDLVPGGITVKTTLSKVSTYGNFTAQLVEGLPPLEESTTQDWTGKYTTPVKDQGYCGSCWAHSVAEQLESDCMREHGTKYVLSPQQLTSCDTKDSGCNGGDMKRAYSWIESYGGLVKDSDYPYTSGRAGITGTCDKSKESNPVVTLTNYYQLRSESDMGSYVGKTGPLSIGVDASTWNSYTGGIMKSCGTRVDHAVQAVGINTGSGYWKVRNSWGTRWGESGFIRLSYGSNTCGITSEATYTKTKKV